MSKIDLSKAKVGDKFRTRDGFIMTYYGCVNYKSKNYYLLKDEDYNKFYYHEYGEFMLDRDSEYDLVEQVLDNEKDIATLERDERINLDMANVVIDIENEQQELQRRQEVVELAEKLWLRNLKDLAGYSYDAAFKDAETFVELKIKYLKDGKLC